MADGERNRKRCGTGQASATTTRTTPWGPRMRRPIFGALLLLGLGCSYAGQSKPGGAPEDDFAAAKAEYESGHYFDAVQKLEQFIDQHPGSVLVDQAIFTLGKAYEAQKDWVMAATQFERLVRDFPESRSTCDAEFLLGRSYWRQSRNAPYDQSETRRALDQLKRYTGRCPDHASLGDADSLIIEATFGFIGGLLAGMLGIGGGAIFVPAIVIFGLTPEADPQKVAQGVSLVVIVATGLLGTFINARQDTIDAWALRWIAVAAVAAALIASLAANAANDRLLQVIYGLTALVLGAEMVLSSARGLRARPAVERV